MARPSEEDVREAVTGAVGKHLGVVVAVIAHGSWVRGDFWDGQSDLDLIIVGREGAVPTQLQRELEALSTPLGVRVEPWATSEQQLSTIRGQRPAGEPIHECGIGQFDISGFDVVDRHAVVWGVDPLEGFPVPRGGDLRSVAAHRMRALVREIDVYGATEMNRVACDALKAAAIFFALKEGQQATRDKREALDVFNRMVPGFEQKATSSVVWELYVAGDKGGDVDHRQACAQFVRALADLVARA